MTAVFEPFFLDKKAGAMSRMNFFKRASGSASAALRAGPSEANAVRKIRIARC
jgi:hypothetical protein